MNWLTSFDRHFCRRLFQAGTHTYRAAEQEILRSKIANGWLPPRRIVVGGVGYWATEENVSMAASPLLEGPALYGRRPAALRLLSRDTPTAMRETLPDTIAGGRSPQEHA